jgi:hypothetical protein
VSEWVEYRSEDSGIALTHPPGWRVSEGAAGAAVAVVAHEPGTGGFSACVTINAAELDGPVDLQDFTKMQLAGIGEFLTDVRLIDQSESSLLGRPAGRLLVTYRQGVHALVLEQWWAVAEAGPGAVVVSGTCAALDYDDYADVFDQVASSLRAEVSNGG